MVCINSNDVTAYPQDSPNNMITTAALYNWSFPYLYDETQETAKSFQARCTPDIFLYDAHNRLFYRGQFDDSRPSSGTADGSDVKLALQSLLQGDPPTTDQKPSVGCNIKWKNEKV
jgi:hypothetical protein